MMRVKDPEELRKWRQRRHLSQRDLAYLCKRSQATISLLERGGMTSLSDELALTLSARLQVPWEDLFDVTDDAAGAAAGTVAEPSDESTRAPGQDDGSGAATSRTSGSPSSV